MTNTALVPVDKIERSILVLRGQRVMLDETLAALYGVEVRSLNQAVRRNSSRFPLAFMFQLMPDETEALRSQLVILKSGRGQHRKYPPYAFTEQGVAMLSSVLNSPRAIEVNIEIMRAFVRLRRMLQVHADLARKLAALEKKYDARFRVVFEAIQELMEPPLTTKRKIGFCTPKAKTR
ncbi:MAG: ORF6N domain-containing protein [Deltaproteobacteria bacterium]|nr:ORF6N domain-containing protein [Deltaproteobacteria bacterium]